MAENESNQLSELNTQSDFMIEKIKERPINKRKLFRRTVTTAAMAVMFGLIACVTFLLLEPVINNWLYPEEEPAPVVFPEDQEEMAPEDMLAENIPSEDLTGEIEGLTDLDQNQIQQILSGVVLDKDNYAQVYDALSSYVDELNHSMVTVTGVSSNLDWFNNVQESKNQSSGLIIANNGKELLVLVDYTSLRKAESMTMTFSYLDAATNADSGYQIPVNLKAQDGNTNLAVLYADLTDIPEEVLAEGGVTIATLGSSNTNSGNLVGTPVIAMGSPMGSSGSVGYGVITAISSQSQKVDANFKLFQTDIYGSQNAGGVLFNLKGQVIGVITNDKTSSDMKNMVNAYGISELRKRIEKISNGKQAAYLGINAVDVTEQVHKELGVPFGAYIRDVEMDSPAMRAGIQQGDVLTAFNGKSILSYNDYITALMQEVPGNTVKLTVMRTAQGDYKEMEMEIVLDVQ